MDLLAVPTVNCTACGVWMEADISVMDAPKLLTQKCACAFSYVTIYVTLGASPQKRP